MKVIDIKAGKAKVERKKYAALVLNTFDRFEHQTEQQRKEVRALVQRNARNQF